MKMILAALVTVFFLHTSVDAADKVRISISNLSGQFMTFPLAQKRGFLEEEGIEAEIIRVTGGAGSAALSSGDLDYGTGMAVGGAMTGLPVKWWLVSCRLPFSHSLRGPRSNQSRSLKARRWVFPPLAVFRFSRRE
jgi:hypothetical protein